MKKILVVDDQSEIRKLISLTLSRRYQVSQAADAAEAYAAIREDPPAAVILDVMMPGAMDGYQLCAELKRDPALRHVHVVLVTARGQAKDQEYGKSVGADAYFVKPFSPLSLVRHLEQALGNPT